MALLEKCVQVIDGSDLFKDDVWKAIKDPILGVAAITNPILNDFFEFLNLSLLAGEYVSKPSECNGLIKQIRERLDKVPGSLELINDNEIKEECQYFLLESLSPIRTSLRSYQSLIHSVEKKVAHDKILFSRSRELMENTLLVDINPESEFLADIFLSSVDIALIDHNLSVDKGQLEKLIMTKRKLEDQKLTPFYKAIIIDKCEFLIRKIHYRFKDDRKNFLYAFEFQDSKIIETKEFKYFKIFHDKTISHYGIGEEMSHLEWKKLYEKIIRDSIKSSNDFHTVLQFYKERVKDIGRIKNLKNLFNKACEENLRGKTSAYDREAIFINRNYFSNNELSLVLENEKTQYNEAIECLEEIRALQKETSINNYYPYLKFCEFLCDLINKKITNLRVNGSDVEKYFNCLESVIEETFKSYEWCFESNFLAFQLPHNEAIINHVIGDRKIELFVASSFVLPINYVKLNIDLQKIRRQTDAFETILQVHKTIAEEKEEIRKIRSEIEKIDRRSIEIIGVFAAIVLFTSGSIQIFSIKGITIKDGLSWMLMFSYSLVLFIFLIWLMTRDGVAIKSLSFLHWFFLAGLLGMWGLSLCYVFGWYPF